MPSSIADVPDQWGPSSSEADQSLPIDPSALCEHIADLVPHLPLLLPASCKWLEQGALEVGGEHPINAGGVVDVWVGMMGDRKVAIKSYRCSSSSDHRLTHVVSGPRHTACILPTEDPSAEVLQRGIGVQSSQRLERRAVSRSVFYPRAPIGSGFSIHGSFQP